MVLHSCAAELLGPTHINGGGEVDTTAERILTVRLMDLYNDVAELSGVNRIIDVQTTVWATECTLRAIRSAR